MSNTETTVSENNLRVFAARFPPHIGERILKSITPKNDEIYAVYPEMDKAKGGLIAYLDEAKSIMISTNDQVDQITVFVSLGNVQRKKLYPAPKEGDAYEMTSDMRGDGFNPESDPLWENYSTNPRSYKAEFAFTLNPHTAVADPEAGCGFMYRNSLGGCRDWFGFKEEQPFPLVVRVGGDEFEQFFKKTFGEDSHFSAKMINAYFSKSFDGVVEALTQLHDFREMRRQAYDWDNPMRGQILAQYKDKLRQLYGVPQGQESQLEMHLL